MTGEGETVQVGNPDLFIRRTNIPRAITTGKAEFKARLGSGADEFFLKFCADLESKERQGNLPDVYSRLSFSDVKETVSQIRTVFQKKAEVRDKEIESIFAEIERESESIKQTNDKESLLKLEEKRSLIETLVLQSENTKRDKIITDSESVEKPWGEIEANSNNLDIWLKSDTHEVPTDAVTQIRAHAFKTPVIYRAQRAFQKILDRYQQFGRFKFAQGNINLGEPDNPNPSKLSNLDLRYAIQEEVRDLYYQWVSKVMIEETGKEFEKGNLQSMIFADLGDTVQDGANFIDQMAAQLRDYGVLDEVENQIKDKHRLKGIKTFLMKISGNHDKDARIGESMAFTNEVFGHRVFTQEAGGILIAGIDTDIENPEWIRQFKSRVGEESESVKILTERQKMQNMVLEKIQNYEGPILLLGHSPSRTLKALAIEREGKLSQILQHSKSKQIKIVSGHTHQEEHVELPFQTSNDGKITLDVIESFVTFSNDTNTRLPNPLPNPLKLFKIKVRNGLIDNVETFSEPIERFRKRYQDQADSQLFYGYNRYPKSDEAT